MNLTAFLRVSLWRLRGVLRRSPGALSLALIALLVFLMIRQAGRVEFVYGYNFGQALLACFGLSPNLLFKGFIWQPLTYCFLHAGWLHLGLNLFTIIFFGAGLESEMGSRFFWRIFISGGVIGGLGWLLTTTLMPFLPAPLAAWWPGDGAAAGATLCIGASGGVFALIGAYAALLPRREVMVLLLFIPLRLKARTLAALLALLTILEALLIRSQIAYTAHLAGGLAGYLLARQQPPAHKRKVFFPA